MTRPRRSETVLTAEHLRRVLLYDPYTGLWKWRQGGKGRPKQPDWWPGTPNKFGYLTIAIGRLAYFTQRLAFLYMEGRWPTEGRWPALIRATHLPVSFATPEEASRAYEQAAGQAFGSFYRRLQ